MSPVTMEFTYSVRPVPVLSSVLRRLEPSLASLIDSLGIRKETRVKRYPRKKAFNRSSTGVADIQIPAEASLDMCFRRTGVLLT